MSPIFPLAVVACVLMLRVSAVSYSEPIKVVQGNVLDIVTNLQQTLMRQERRIQELENRDLRRQKLLERLDLKVKKLEASCSSLEIQNKLIHGEKQDTGNVKSSYEMPNTIDNKHVPLPSTRGTARRQIMRVAEHVAFSVYMDHNVDHMAHGHTIKMNQVLLNDGDAYNNTTGIFTVPVSGVYLFTFHFNSHYRKTIVGLFVDGRNQVDAISVPKDATQEMMGGNTAILQMSAGQSVWLEDIIVDDGDIFSVPFARYATLSGVLLY